MTPLEIIAWALAIGSAAICMAVCVMWVCYAVDMIRDTWKGK